MSGHDERWMELCAQAAIEKDPAKLLQLVEEINDLLEAKQAKQVRPVPPKPNGHDAPE